MTSEWGMSGGRWLAQALSTTGRHATSNTLAAIHAAQAPEPPDDEDIDWLEADLSRLSDDEPYDWGGHDPLTMGKAVTLGDDGTVQVGEE